MFTDELFGFGELFERCVDIDRFVDHVRLDVVGAGLLELALVGENFRLEPRLIQVVYIVHLFCSFA